MEYCLATVPIGVFGCWRHFSYFQINLLIPIRFPNSPLTNLSQQNAYVDKHYRPSNLAIKYFTRINLTMVKNFKLTVIRDFYFLPFVF